MPETFRRTEEIIKYLRDHRIPPITLLVVPGRQWNSQQLKRLHKLEEVGYEMAAHGWRHEVTARGGLYHRLHSALLSRNVAEHLALDSGGILDLMQRSRQWFVDNGFSPPRLYVPPAWALGPITPGHLAQVPFDRIEVLSGLLNPQTGVVYKMPVVGFEADSPLRAAGLRIWNAWQMRRVRLRSQPVRLGIHPDDFYLRLAAHLRAMIEESYLYQNYAELESV